jgi:hypothetical protein
VAHSCINTEYYAHTPAATQDSEAFHDKVFLSYETRFCSWENVQKAPPLDITLYNLIQCECGRYLVLANMRYRVALEKKTLPKVKHCKGIKIWDYIVNGTFKPDANMLDLLADTNGDKVPTNFFD